MRRFQFRLDRVMGVRRNRERICQQELAMAHEVLRVGEEDLARLEASETACAAAVRGQFSGVIRPVSIAGHLAYLRGLRRDAIHQQEVVDGLAAEVEEKRADLLRASQEKKVLENLRERRYLSYRKDLNRREQTFLDEVAQQRCGSIRSVVHGGEGMHGG